MLVVDDFNEILAIEAFLKRLGFDVLCLGKERLVSDALLGFFPDLVLASAKGRGIDGIQLSMQLKKQTPSPKTVLLYPSGSPLALSDEARAVVDGVAELPIQPHALIQVVARLSNLPDEPLIKKFEMLNRGLKTTLGATQDDAESEGRNEGIRIVSGSAPEKTQTQIIEWHPQKNPRVSTTSRTSRSDRYDKFLKENDDDVSATLSRAKMSEAAEKLRKESSSESESLEEIDQEKREFAKALFVTGRGNGRHKR